jgi:hypothetical protein
MPKLTPIALLTTTLTLLPISAAFANYLIIESGSVTLRTTNGSTQAAWTGLTLRPGELLLPNRNAIAYYICTNGNSRSLTAPAGIADLCGGTPGYSFDPKGDLASGNIFLALLNDYFIPNSTIANPDLPAIPLLATDHTADIQLDPLTPEAHTELADTLTTLQASDLSDSARMIVIAERLIAAGLALDAIAYLERMSDRPPILDRWLGDLHIQLGRYDEAIGYYEKVIAATDDDREQMHAAIGLAHATAALDEFERTADWLTQASTNASAISDLDTLDIIEQWHTKLDHRLNTTAR